MSGPPCEACGQPRGRGSRCKECGYDRYATRLDAVTARTSSAPATSSDGTSSRPGSRSAGTPRTAPRTSPEDNSRPTRSSGSGAREAKPAPAGGSSAPAEAAAGQPRSQPTPVRQPATAQSGPTVAGRVVSIRPTPVLKDDRPWWLPVVYALAMLPGLAALAVIQTRRSLTRRTRHGNGGILPSLIGAGGFSPRRNWTPSPSQAAGGVGVLLGYRFGRAGNRVDCSLIRLSSPGGEVVCRCLVEPAVLPVAQGDDLSVWGVPRPDGILRATRIENQTNGTTYKVTLVNPFVAASAVASLLLCLLVLFSVI